VLVAAPAAACACNTRHDGKPLAQHRLRAWLGRSSFQHRFRAFALPSPFSQDGKSSAHGGGGGGGQPLGEAELAVLDDCTQFERICAQLQACAGGQADEAQLKVGQALL
jgi:hypothetical protein